MPTIRQTWFAPAIALMLVSACSQKAAQNPAPTPTPTPTPPPPLFEKVDVLFVVDNSRAMADKQQVFVQAATELVQELANPPCVDSSGTTTSQPATGDAACPDGTSRSHPPAIDIHVGLITSSLGGFGSDACPAQEKSACPVMAVNTTQNDRGHLISRTDPCTGGAVPTYKAEGYLAWDPLAQQTPPGETSLGEVRGVMTVTPGLLPAVKDMILGAGQLGCGYEATLESLYHFLIDPEPWESITLSSGGAAELNGVDSDLLQQRAAFLRPKSTVIVAVLSDEDDASLRLGSSYYLAYQQRDPGNPSKNFHLPRARSECTTDPGNACCLSCGQAQGTCAADSACSSQPVLTDIEDHPNVRTFDQKRRFGIDFLAPTDRYVTGLTSKTVPNRAGASVPNPLFAEGRVPERVFLLGIVGVPWQDVAKDPAVLAQGFRTRDELDESRADAASTWDIIVGQPSTYVAATDPYMKPSIDARSGSNPITQTPVVAPGGGGAPSPINGSEYTIAFRDDLQYACISPLPAGTARDCSNPSVIGCDCGDPTNDSPLCEDRGDGARTIQVRAKAYPAPRHLSVLKGLGSQGVVASACWSQVTNTDNADYGYRPAVNALMERLIEASKK